MLLFLALACTDSSSKLVDDGAVADTGAGGDQLGEWEGSAEEGGDGGDGGGETGGVDSGGDTSSQDTAVVEQGPCFEDIGSLVDYAGTGAVLNSTCTGTDHQEITGVERVVFVGDSITAGAPIPTDWSSWDLTAADEWYRNILAEELTDRWGLDGPDWFWENVSLLSGESYTPIVGDFANCSKWGARTDDLYKDNTQLADCIPEEDRDKHNLVILTIGGNDLYSLLDDLKSGVDEQSIRDEWQEAIDDLSEAMHWLTDDREQFPGGVSVVLANIFDVTDETGAADIADCEGAELIGLSEPLLDPLTAELARHWQQSVVELSVETGIDVIFLGETFCGRGYNYDDATGRCYRGGEVDNYLDASCEHPSKYGHEAIAELVLSVIDE